MYKLKVEAYFSAAHKLRGYKGKCEELHGHNWKVEMAVASKDLDRIGMVADFKKLKGALNSVSDKLDHKYLNNLAVFKEINPTSENIAKYIYEQVKLKLPKVKSVTVWESENSSAAYDEE